MLDAGITKPDYATGSKGTENRVFSFASMYEGKIVTIPRCRDGLARRIGARFISARRNALLTQLAHMPILLIYHVPKDDGIIRIKITSVERLGMEEPITQD